MAFDSRAVREAAQLILNEIAADHRYGHTSHLQVRVAGETIVDEHLRGPVINNVFSITKSVLASALGVMAADDLLPPLDSPVADVLPVLRETPARSHTWRHLLTMTRGARDDGPWEIDAVTARPSGHVVHIANAPQLHPPGTRFAYENGGAHLVSAAASEILGEPVSDVRGPPAARPDRGERPRLADRSGGLPDRFARTSAECRCARRPGPVVARSRAGRRPAPA